MRGNFKLLRQATVCFSLPRALVLIDDFHSPVAAHCVVSCGTAIEERFLKNYVRTIDQGRTSTGFIVFNQDARVVAVARKEHPADLSATRGGSRTTRWKSSAGPKKLLLRLLPTAVYSASESRCHWNYQSTRDRSAKPVSHLPMPSSGKTRESRTTCGDSPRPAARTASARKLPCYSALTSPA